MAKKEYQNKAIPNNFPVQYGFGPQEGQNDIKGLICRKKGEVTVQFCAQCPDFQPAAVVSDGDVLDGNDGIDPRTGNSYATCKWFGEIVRYNPLYLQAKRELKEKTGWKY